VASEGAGTSLLTIIEGLRGLYNMDDYVAIDWETRIASNIAKLPTLMGKGSNRAGA
jgi:hypothetical protein